MRFAADGRAPCVVQDARSGEVVTLAYVNDVALAKTSGPWRRAYV